RRGTDRRTSGAGSGPAGVIGQRQDSLRKIINSSNSTSISYLGNPNIIYTNKQIIPFKFNFASPVIINANSGFYAGITNPIVNLDSIKVFTNTKFNPAMDSSAWFLTSTNTWRTYKTHRKMKIQMAIIPQITCSPVLGINSTVLNETMLQVFPNPSKGIFNLLLNMPVQEMVQIRVCNILGHVISSLTLNHADTQVLQLDLSAYPKGIYLLQVQNASQTLSKRIVLD
ncbi:MAG: T9SS type A sorting domain-containing protein, partial [Bacteroidia bacterium]